MNGHQIADVGLDEQVDRLIELAQVGDETQVRRLLGRIVPEYRPEVSPPEAFRQMFARE